MRSGAGEAVPATPTRILGDGGFTEAVGKGRVNCRMGARELSP
jgi:hypothetical protein